MSIWTRIGEALAALTSGESLSTVFEKLRQRPERTVAFTIDRYTTRPLVVEGGQAVAPTAHGIGVTFLWDVLEVYERG